MKTPGEEAATGRVDRRLPSAAAATVASTPRGAWEAAPPHAEPHDAGAPSTALIDRLGPLLSRGKAAARRWLSEGNVPVKIGMLVLFAGIAALIKYATDQGWLAFCAWPASPRSPSWAWPSAGANAVAAAPSR